ncbi:MAG: substrate-binding domain-containing protein [Acidobacteria bacterium]|nr:substrate-binding domain-containing protein [Acidobacteriota bacterium]
MFKLKKLMGLFWLTLACGCARREQVVLFCPESLTPLLEQATIRFEKNHPGIAVQMQSAPDFDNLALVYEQRAHPHLLLTEDARLIPLFAGQNFHEAYAFLGDEIVLAFHKDPSADGHVLANWYDFLNESYGILDPRRLPAGYYAHLLWKLAEVHYGFPGFYRRTLERLSPKWIHSEQEALIGQLRAGNLDFAFVYRSLAVQQQLAHLRLPARISLTEDSYDNFYGLVFYHVQPRSLRRFEVKGAPLRYGVALRDNSATAAQAVFRFLLSAEFQELAQELGYSAVRIKRIS